MPVLINIIITAFKCGYKVVYFIEYILPFIYYGILLIPCSYKIYVIYIYTINNILGHWKTIKLFKRIHSK